METIEIIQVFQHSPRTASTVKTIRYSQYVQAIKDVGGEHLDLGIYRWKVTKLYAEFQAIAYMREEEDDELTSSDIECMYLWRALHHVAEHNSRFDYDSMAGAMNEHKVTEPLQLIVAQIHLILL